MQRGLLSLVLIGRLLLAGTVRAQSQEADCGILGQLFTQSNLTAPWKAGLCCDVKDSVKIQCDAAKRITSANLSGVGLVGTMPSNIRQLTQLQNLSLANNNMVGLVPNLTTLSLLTDLNLSGNNLSGNMDAKLPRTLTSCNLLSTGNTGMFSCQKNIPAACLPTFFESSATFSKSCRAVTRTTSGAATAAATQVLTFSEPSTSGAAINPWAAAIGAGLAGIAVLGSITIAVLSLRYNAFKKSPAVRPSLKAMESVRANTSLNPTEAGLSPGEMGSITRVRPGDPGTLESEMVRMPTLKGELVPTLVDNSRYLSPQAATTSGLDIRQPEVAHTTDSADEAPPHWFFSAMKSRSELTESAKMSFDLNDDTVFVATTKYDPESHDEVALAPGDCVWLERVCPDGWASGHNLTTGAKGYLPL